MVFTLNAAVVSTELNLKNKQMAITSYEKEDIFPLVISVLDECYLAYLFNSYKVIIETDFPDLKGEINVDLLDDHAIALLNSYDNEWMTVVKNIIFDIGKAEMSIANLYNLDGYTVIEDKRIKELAIEFYYDLELDLFRPIKEEYAVDMDFNDKFYWFSDSILLIVNCLCELIVCEGKIDLDLASMSDVAFLDGDYDNEEHFNALHVLQKLGWRLEKHQGDVVNFDI